MICLTYLFRFEAQSQANAVAVFLSKLPAVCSEHSISGRLLSNKHNFMGPKKYSEEYFNSELQMIYILLDQMGRGEWSLTGDDSKGNKS